MVASRHFIYLGVTILLFGCTLAENDNISPQPFASSSSSAQSTLTPVDQPPRRGPGRPPIIRAPNASSSSSAQSTLTPVDQPPRRGPGRPPKAPNASSSSSAQSTLTPVDQPPRRGPGRPPKAPNASSSSSAQSTLTPVDSISPQPTASSWGLQQLDPYDELFNQAYHACEKAAATAQRIAMNLQRKNIQGDTYFNEQANIMKEADYRNRQRYYKCVKLQNAKDEARRDLEHAEFMDGIWHDYTYYNIDQ